MAEEINKGFEDDEEFERFDGMDLNDDEIERHLKRVESHVTVEQMKRTIETRKLSLLRIIKTKEGKKYITLLLVIGTIFFFLLTLLICYVFGCLFKATNKLKNIRILAVDLDGQMFGESLRAGYEMVKSDNFLTFDFVNDTYTTPEQISHQVFKGNYWGAIYTKSGSTESFLSALKDSGSEFNSSDVLYYVWNQAHYTSVSNEVIYEILSEMGEITRTAFYQLFSSEIYKNYISDNATAKSLDYFLNPISISEINLQPTNQLESFAYNTLVIVIVCLIMFFFMMGSHLISVELQIYNKFSRKASFIFRQGLSVIFGLLYSLMLAGSIWWFREEWDVNGNQFVLTWMVFFLLMHVNFTFYDCFACFLPVFTFPIIIITWIIVSVMSCIVPMPLTPGFYHWAVSLPSFNAYNLLTSIWSKGASPIAYRALPILFGWDVILFSITIPGHVYRCKKAAGVPLPDDEVEKLVHQI